MSEVKQIFKEIDSALKRDVSSIQGIKAVYQINLNDEAPGIYQLVLREEDSYTTEGEKETPDCTLQMGSKDFIKLVEGELNGTRAFMSGKLRIKGDMGLALKLQHILSVYNKK